MMGRLVVYRVYFPARLIWCVFLPVLQEIWNTSGHHHILVPDLFFPVRKAAGEYIYEYTLRGWANEICLTRLLLSLYIGERWEKICFNFNQRIWLQKHIMLRIGILAHDKYGLKNRTLNLSRMTCPEYRIHSCKSWFSRHADIAIQTVSYSWLVIILYRHECSCYWIC